MSGMLHSWGHRKKGNSGLSVWVRAGTEISPPLPIFHDGPSLLDVFGEPLYALSSQRVSSRASNNCYLMFFFCDR